MTADHIVPQSMGGQDTPNNPPTHVQAMQQQTREGRVGAREGRARTPPKIFARDTRNAMNRREGKRGGRRFAGSEVRFRRRRGSGARIASGFCRFRRFGRIFG
jgi:hypothetical protein